MDVEWMMGTYTTAWRPWRIRNKRKSTVWTDSIPRSSVILFDFELTSSRHLRKATVEHLKRCYADVRSN